MPSLGNASSTTCYTLNTTWYNDNDYNDTCDDDDNSNRPPIPSTTLNVAFALVRYLFPLIILVGTTGNVLSAAVMLRRGMRTMSIYCYLRPITSCSCTLQTISFKKQMMIIMIMMMFTNLVN